MGCEVVETLCTDELAVVVPVTAEDEPEDTESCELFGSLPLSPKAGCALFGIENGGCMGGCCCCPPKRSMSAAPMVASPHIGN